MQKLSQVPKNPKHFLSLCFKELRNNPYLRQSHDYMILVKEEKGIAIFKTAYGYFKISKNSRQVSPEFFKLK